MHDIWVKFQHLVHESPSIPILVGLGTIYLSYYLLHVGKKPYIAAKSGGYLEKFLLKHCPIVKEKFWPTFWCFEARAQTILRALLQKGPKFDYSYSEPLSLPDGGQVKLDWYWNKEKNDPKQPTVLILPGLTGSSDDCYIRIFVEITANLGYRAVVFNNRGNGGAKLMTPKTYCAADTADLEHVVTHISEKYKDAPLMGMGISLGGMILYNYLARIGDNCSFVGAMIISVAWNPMKSSVALERPLDCFLFNRMLAKQLVENIQNIILGNYIAAQGSACRMKAAMMHSACWDLVQSSRHLEEPVTKILLNKPITYNCRNLFQRIILFNYLAAVGDKCPLKVAFLASAAWNLPISSNHIERPLNKLMLNRPLAWSLVQKLFRRMILFNYLATKGDKTPIKVAMVTSVAWDVKRSTLNLERLSNRYTLNLPLARGLVNKTFKRIILGNFLSDVRQSSHKLTAAMMLSSGWNIPPNVKFIESPMNMIAINKPCAYNLVNAFKRNMEMFEDNFDVGHIMKSSTIREFDERFTSKMFGFASCDAYYQQASLHDKLHHIKIPVLSLNAADDPFSLLETIPVKEMEANDNIACVITSHGGHIGFLDGIWPRRHTYMNRLYAEFVQAVFTHGDELKQS